MLLLLIVRYEKYTTLCKMSWKLACCFKMLDMSFSRRWRFKSCSSRSWCHVFATADVVMDGHVECLLCNYRYYDDADRDLAVMGRGMQGNRASQHSRFSDTVLQVSSPGGNSLEQGMIALCEQVTDWLTNRMFDWVGANLLINYRTY